MHLIKIRNKRYIKMVAVASLAALMTIPILTTYAESSVEIRTKRLKIYEEQLEKYKAYGNTEMVELTKERIEQTKQQLAEAQQHEAKELQKKADQAAAQAEKERIANTVYPLTARYVKDFVPAVNDGKPHLYERPDLPGVIFTLEVDSLGTVIDVKPNVEISEGEDFHRDSYLGMKGSPQVFDNINQTVKISYISPFNFYGKIMVAGTDASDLTPDTEKNGNTILRYGWCHWIGKNQEVIYSRSYHKTYKSGWPDYYIGRHVHDITEANCDPNYGWFPNNSSLRKVSLEEIKNNLKVEFSPRESFDMQHNAGYAKLNTENGNAWVHEQDIYSVAREHGTDYTEEERQTLVIKPTPVNPYTNAGSEPIVDEQEWIDANINYDRNPQSLSDEEWWK